MPTPEENYTRCPACLTVFRVTGEQLALRDGQVRCGQCKAVFDGVAQHVSIAPPAQPEGDPAAPGDAAPAPSSLAMRDGEVQELERELETDLEIETLAAPGSDDVAIEASEDRFSPEAHRPRRARAVAYGLAIAALVLLIAGQAIFHFRDSIAAHWPPARPVLEGFCNAAGCSVRPLRDAAMSYLSIDASDLQADPAHRGLLILTATLRNRAAWELSYPHLELTLTDSQDRVVVRRALAPVEYAGGTADLTRGIAPNGEVAVKMFIDASATAQAGYRLYMFYP
jgi:predicted Zn finger-like uncharacterized protein